MGRFQSESVAEQIYRAFTRKNSVYVSVIMIGAIVGERVKISTFSWTEFLQLILAIIKSSVLSVIRLWSVSEHYNRNHIRMFVENWVAMFCNMESACAPGRCSSQTGVKHVTWGLTQSLPLGWFSGQGTWALHCISLRVHDILQKMCMWRSHGQQISQKPLSLKMDLPGLRD